MKPWLILDCYLDPAGGADNFRSRMGSRPSEVARTAYGDVPTSAAPYAGVLITGSGASIPEGVPWVEPTVAVIRDAVARSLPIFGACFGHQLLAYAVSGPQAVRRAARPEVGYVPVEVLAEDPILEGFGSRFTCFVSHEDEVVPDPAGLEVLARSEQCPVHALRVPGKPIWGVQFHTEMSPEEEEKTMRWRAERHPELGLDPDAMLERRVDSARLAERILGNFFRAVE